ncbi:hypothetical protein ACFVYA_44735 [Amycolatopsis sp. NPDC058278]|uniref:hypothetical protein n=1 Tax=Amycolatopsis sp. NPDC058278 TaxID=3346417 RepID=UPI0036D860F5
MFIELTQQRRRVHPAFLIAASAFDRPHPLRMPTTGGQHAPIAVLIGPEPPGVQHVLTFVDDLDGGGPLVGIHTDDH